MVPREATARVDVRVATVGAGEEMSARMLSLKPRDPDVTIEVTGGMNRPPYERNAAVDALFVQAQSLSAKAGLDLQSTALTGGGSAPKARR